jgi:hypothetical protein
MAGMSQFQLMMANSDDLIRAAQAGDKDALMQLQTRGEMNPTPPPFRFGRNAQDDGTPAPWRFGQNARDRTPVFALERGPTTRDMARPAQLPMEQPPLPYMSAINQRPGEHPALGMNLGNTAPADDPIARIANGMDAAAPIQAGVQAADADAEADGAAAPGPMQPAGMSAMDEDADPNGYGGMVASLINDLRNGVNGPDANRRRALGEAGFAMAASGNPFFFGAVGQGGLAGMKAYREAEAADMESQVRAATLGSKELERMEDVRSNKTDEQLTRERDAETRRSNVTQEGLEKDRNTEARRSNRASEALQAGQLRISGQNAQTALGQLNLAQQQFQDEQQRYQEGKADDAALKKAEIKYREALAKAQESLDVDRGTDIIYTQDGGAAIVSKRDGTTVPVVDKDGNPIKAVQKSATQTAAMKNAKYYVDIGLFGSEREAAAASMRGKSMSPDRRLVEAYDLADGKIATDPTLMGEEAAQARERYAQEYYGILGGDVAPETTPSSAPPATGRGAAATSGNAPPVEGARKAKDGNWYVPDPNRPGKYLQVK